METRGYGLLMFYFKISMHLNTRTAINPVKINPSMAFNIDLSLEPELRKKREIMKYMIALVTKYIVKSCCPPKYNAAFVTPRETTRLITNR